MARFAFCWLIKISEQCQLSELCGLYEISHVTPLEVM